MELCFNHSLEVHTTICAPTHLMPFLSLSDHHEKLLLSYLSAHKALGQNFCF